MLPLLKQISLMALFKYVNLCYFFQGASSFKEAMRMGAEIYQNLKKVVKKKYGIDGR